MVSSSCSPDHEVSRSVSQPFVPVPDHGYPSVSHDRAHIAPRGRNTSLSRVQDNLRKTTTHIQHRLERKLLLMAESHLDIPLPLHGPQGLLFHVPDMPGAHSRESVSDFLHQSVDWLRSNPERGSSSPFKSTDSSVGETVTDLLGSDIERIDSPCLEPAPSHEFSSQTPISHTSCMTGNSEEDLAHLEGMSNPTHNGLLIDLDVQAEVEPPFPEPNSSQPSQRRDVHPDLTSLISFFEQKSVSATHSPAINTRRTRATNIKRPALAETNMSLMSRPEPSRQNQKVKTYINPDCPTTKLRSSETQYRFVPPRTSSATKTNTKPFPTSAYLSVGLRPVLPVSLTIAPTAPSGATSSTEFLERKDLPMAPMSSQRTLSRKQNDTNLRRLNLTQKSFAIESAPQPKHATFPTRQITQINVEETTDRYEKPLPSIPVGKLNHRQKTLRRSTKRLGLIGMPPSPTLETVLSPAQANLSKSDGETKPFGKFIPYRAAFQPPTVTISSPCLPTIPNTPKGSMLKDIKKELFESSDKALLMSSMRWSSLSQEDSLHNHETKGLDKDTTPATAYLRQDYQPTYLPYSRAIVRSGTLQQLGGRVVEVRKPSETETYNMPSSSRSQDHTGSNRRQDRSERPENSMRSVLTPRAGDQIALNQSHDTQSRHRRHQDQSPFYSSRLATSQFNYSRNSFDPNTPADPPLYALLNRNQDPSMVRDYIAQESRRRIIAAADEADFAASWQRAVMTGRDSEVIRKLDYATVTESGLWGSKRTIDAGRDGKEQESRRQQQDQHQIPHQHHAKGKVKQKAKTKEVSQFDFDSSDDEGEDATEGR